MLSALSAALILVMNPAHGATGDSALLSSDAFSIREKFMAAKPLAANDLRALQSGRAWTCTGISMLDHSPTAEHTAYYRFVVENGFVQNLGGSAIKAFSLTENGLEGAHAGKLIGIIRVTSSGDLVSELALMRARSPGFGLGNVNIKVDGRNVALQRDGVSAIARPLDLAVAYSYCSKKSVTEENPETGKPEHVL